MPHHYKPTCSETNPLNCRRGGLRRTLHELSPFDSCRHDLPPIATLRHALSLIVRQWQARLTLTQRLASGASPIQSP